MPSSLYVVCVVIAICWFIKSKYFCFCSTKWLTQYLFLERLCLSGSVGSGQLWKAYSPGRSVYLINIHWRKAISPPIVNWSWEILVPILWFWNLFPMSNWIYFIGDVLKSIGTKFNAGAVCLLYHLSRGAEFNQLIGHHWKKWASIP